MKCWLNTLLLFIIQVASMASGLKNRRCALQERINKISEYGVRVWTAPSIHLPLRSFHTINCESTVRGVFVDLTSSVSKILTFFFLVSILNARTDKSTHQNHEMLLSVYCWAFLVLWPCGKNYCQWGRLVPKFFWENYCSNFKQRLGGLNMI